MSAAGVDWPAARTPAASAHADRVRGISIEGIDKHFGPTLAINAMTATLEPGTLTGLVGPDGAGKTTLLRIIAGLMKPDRGRVTVVGLDAARDRDAVHSRVGYMPQRFGLYEDLSVEQNLVLYADLKSIPDDKRGEVFEKLYRFTRLAVFRKRVAGALSGGMKQKLGLACALMGEPDVLLLDEPSAGVDPLSRRDLWAMVQALAAEGMAVVWSTAYLDEAERCAQVVLLDHGKLIYCGTPAGLTARLDGRSYRVVGIDGDRRKLLSEGLALAEVRDGVIQGASVRLVRADGASEESMAALGRRFGARLEAIAPRFEDAFIDLLGGGPDGHSALTEHMQPLAMSDRPMVECTHLVKRFGTFVATNDVTFTVNAGEVFGLLGPNGAGKSTLFRMLCGLLKPSSGQAEVAGYDLARAPEHAKASLGYMAQKFSLYGLLSVGQNLDFFSGAYRLTGATRRQRIDEMVDIFDLGAVLSRSPAELPLGYRQRLALACSLMHRPRVLFLDEPTSGVDPITRREFWIHISGLVTRGVTIMVTTHFMDEAEYCDRVALVQDGCLIELASPDALKAKVADSELPEPTMEDAFIRLVESRRRDPSSSATDKGSTGRASPSRASA